MINLHIDSNISETIRYFDKLEIALLEVKGHLEKVKQLIPPIMERRFREWDGKYAGQYKTKWYRKLKDELGTPVGWLATKSSNRTDRPEDLKKAMTELDNEKSEYKIDRKSKNITTLTFTIFPERFLNRYPEKFEEKFLNKASSGEKIVAIDDDDVLVITKVFTDELLKSIEGIKI